ncbi:class I SAM-dependent methyltransferase [Hyphobacterium marinum]|uniref:Class I SAM-dependent methyltransferase n=1 Tax=Hyphobacterium marinum TaxID=3116574 RepID=A0ABU7LZR4_9PROT|nr:class I SAM-dependent methyltransferase [Hyphobacterium sp. Y6023]MEE2567038.1 class I SAM-dependent methyltransferase [Hyphobacterium sp. Y6023]
MTEKTPATRPLETADWTPAPCDLCGGQVTIRLGERAYTVRGRTRDFEMNFEDAACAACGFVFAARRPDSGFLMAYYRDAHIGHRGGELHFDGEKRLAAVAERTPKGGRVIEIGANDGAFCAKLTEMGFDAFGLDPVEADEAESVGKGFIGEGRSGIAEPRSADTVVAYYVLEHVIDANAWLAELIDLLKDGGTLILEVPNYETHPGDSLNPEHLLHFTPRSLRELLVRHGLEPEDGLEATVRYGQAIAAKLVDRAKAARPAEPSDVYFDDAAAALERAQAAYKVAKAERTRRTLVAHAAAELAAEADPSGKASVFAWGANEYAERVAPLLTERFETVRVIDRSASKIGTPFPGLDTSIAGTDVIAEADRRIFLLCSPNWNRQIADEIAASGWEALAVIDAVTGEILSAQ